MSFLQNVNRKPDDSADASALVVFLTLKTYSQCVSRNGLFLGHSLNVCAKIAVRRADLNDPRNLLDKSSRPSMVQARWHRNQVSSKVRSIC